MAPAAHEEKLKCVLDRAFFNDRGLFTVLLGRCPHANGPLGRGWIEEGEAVCPLHRWRFKLSTGRCTTI